MAKAPSTPARREYARNRQRKYRAANPDRVRGYECKYRASNLLMIRRNALRYARLNLPAPTRPMPELCERGCGRKASCLDHCHTTNVFRGWLCKGCNAGIGMLGDTIKDLLAGVDYLQRVKP